MIDRVRTYILQQRLLQPGDRVAVAVSGGADSVSLLRVLLELRQELGIVLSAAHFHHGIRGAEADADQLFVSELAGRFELELHVGAGDVPAHARRAKSSVETAARELRHRWFAGVLAQGKADKIATAHTLDDQAETVLMRLLRGAGARGLAGIFPAQKEKRLVRPLLKVSRRDVEAYLSTIGQAWREDASNRDPSHTRNRIRHELLPLLERDYNPAIRHTLAELAEIARADAEYWDAQTATLLPRLLREGIPSRSGRTSSGAASRTLALDLSAFQGLPLAFKRQLLHRLGAQLGTTLEFNHIEQLIELVHGKPRRRRVPLPGDTEAELSFRELRFGPIAGRAAVADYQYVLPVPGQVEVPELGSVIRARLVPARETPAAGYDAGAVLDRALLAPELTVRNWRAGDRFFPARTRSPKKVKELLEAGRLGQRLTVARRKAWPVVESTGQIVWMRGFPTPEMFTPRDAQAGDVVLIEEIDLKTGTEE
ncbi:MAG TPA: tRNA lysidine(34) synthetase TilS [Candidatus Angelobacter sp.]|nr:tRNA lysidine(34) synthetase TilS [Candidatus Angelobacter sp.]